MIYVPKPQVSRGTSLTRSNFSCTSTATNTPPSEVLCTVINQEHPLDERGSHGTALHFAAHMNNVPAARLLLANGAAIDKLDSSGRNALMMAPSQAMATLLVRHGASLVGHFSSDITKCSGWRIQWFADITSVYPGASIGHDRPSTTPAFLVDTYDTRGTIDCTRLTITPAHLATLLKTNVNLKQEFGIDRSLMHLAIASQASSTFVLNSELGLEGTTPFPWHMSFWNELPFLLFMFRHFRKKLSDTDFVRIAHLQPTRGRSPLCLASIIHNIELMHNCLSLGADVDFEGSPHGSALILAAGCGDLEAVRILVRAGASLSYTGRKGHKSVFTLCRSTAIRRWLLVDRFTEQRRIDTGPFWGNDETVRTRAGTATARLKLVGNRAMCYHETMIEYAGRLAWMRKEWRGKVIPPICMEGIVHRE